MVLLAVISGVRGQAWTRRSTPTPHVISGSRVERAREEAIEGRKKSKTGKDRVQERVASSERRTTNDGEEEEEEGEEEEGVSSVSPYHATAGWLTS